MSSDRTDKRDREYYLTLRSFDQTGEAPIGAVGEDRLPFGIEYRASVVLREVNTGFGIDSAAVPFGVDQKATEQGFLVCRDCCVIVPSDKELEKVNHRRSCSQHRKNDKRRQGGRSAEPFNWEHIYLYRELRSEAIRLFLPSADLDDLETLQACIYLGLRRRFEGNPAHLIVAPQILPDHVHGTERHYLVLMDAVPGGTGYLKTLYQEESGQQLAGEGVMDVLRRARNALETCPCRRQDPTRPSSDGCYRCIRTYHLQYSAEQISAERGIQILNELIESGEKRVKKQELEDIRANSL